MAMALEQARMNVRWASGLDIIAGLWMIAAPFMLAYGSSTVALWNSIVSGAIIAVLAASRETANGYRHAAASWVNAAIGVWLVIAPYVLNFSSNTVATSNHIITGIAVIIFAAWSALSTPHEQV